jgi:hypothetical protein
MVPDELAERSRRLRCVEPPDHLGKGIAAVPPFVPEDLVSLHVNADGLGRHACTVHARGESVKSVDYLCHAPF